MPLKTPLQTALNQLEAIKGVRIVNDATTGRIRFLLTFR